MLRPVCVMILALSAAACGSDANERAPANKILARSTTDEMLPLETVQSQAPLARPEGSGPAHKAGGKDAKEGGEPASEAADTIAPRIESPPPPTDTIGAAISGQSAPE